MMCSVFARSSTSYCTIQHFQAQVKSEQCIYERLYIYTNMSVFQPHPESHPYKHSLVVHHHDSNPKTFGYRESIHIFFTCCFHDVRLNYCFFFAKQMYIRSIDNLKSQKFASLHSKFELSVLLYIVVMNKRKYLKNYRLM